MVVYEAVIGWIKHDQDNRENLLSGSIKVVRFAYVSSAFLTDVVAEEPMISDNHDAMNIYSKALKLKLTSPLASIGKKVEPQPKRRVNVANQVVREFEKFNKEQKIQKLERSAAGISDMDALKMQVTELFEKIIVKPYSVVAAFTVSKIVDPIKNKDFLPLLEDGKNLFTKYIITPVKKSPCIPKEGEENPFTKYILTPVQTMPCLPKEAEENPFEKYIVTPIKDSPCIPKEGEENPLEKYIIAPIKDSPCIPKETDGDMNVMKGSGLPTFNGEEKKEDEWATIDANPSKPTVAAS